MWKLYKTELYKVWKRPLFLSFTILPVFYFLYLLFAKNGISDHILHMMPYYNNNFTSAFYYVIFGRAVLINFIIFVVTGIYYFNMEVKNNCRINLSTLPYKITNIYLGKTAVLATYVLINGLLIYIFHAVASFYIYKDLSIIKIVPFIFTVSGWIFIVLFQFAAANFIRKPLFYFLFFITLFTMTMIINQSKLLAAFLPYNYISLYKDFIFPASPSIKEYILPLYIIAVLLTGFYAFKRQIHGKI